MKGNKQFSEYPCVQIKAYGETDSMQKISIIIKVSLTGRKQHFVLLFLSQKSIINSPPKIIKADFLKHLSFKKKISKAEEKKLLFGYLDQFPTISWAWLFIWGKKSTCRIFMLFLLERNILPMQSWFLHAIFLDIHVCHHVREKIRKKKGVIRQGVNRKAQKNPEPLSQKKKSCQNNTSPEGKFRNGESWRVWVRSKPQCVVFPPGQIFPS